VWDVFRLDDDEAGEFSASNLSQAASREAASNHGSASLVAADHAVGVVNIIAGGGGTVPRGGRGRKNASSTTPVYQSQPEKEQSVGRNESPPPPVARRQHEERWSVRHARVNKNYEPVPLMSNLPRTPPRIYEAIADMIRTGLGFQTPREYQVDTIFHLAFRKVKLMYLIRKTGEGKSLVILGLALALSGIVVAMGPLHGLGTDQANKSKRPFAGLEAYHVDEFRDEDYDKLVHRLSLLDSSQHRRIVLYISPQALRDSNSKWNPILRQLAKDGLIKAFVVDEVHTAVEYSDSFRPEFKDGIDAINNLIDYACEHNPTLHIPTLAMSATFRIPEQKLFNTLYGSPADLVCWGDMDKRSVSIFCSVEGNPLTSLANDLTSGAAEDAQSQFLVYSNSAQACEQSVMQRIEGKLGVVAKENIDGKVMFALTGKLGIMGKSYLAEAFAGEDNDSFLPTIWCMPCTEAAQCGVSSKKCNKCFRYGFIPSSTMMAQELGRVNRMLLAVPGEHGYFVYANVTSYLSLWIRAMRQPSKRVRDRHEEQLLNNTARLILPTECYHTSIEREFENPATFVDRGPCGTLCSYCTGGTKKLTGRFSRVKLIAALMSNIFDRGSVLAKKFVGFITDKTNQNKLRKQIWGDGVGVSSGNIHALVLQLLVAGMIEPFLQPEDMAGNDNIQTKHVMLRLKKRIVPGDDGDFDDFMLHNRESWSGFNCHD